MFDTITATKQSALIYCCDGPLSCGGLERKVWADRKMQIPTHQRFIRKLMENVTEIECGYRDPYEQLYVSKATMNLTAEHKNRTEASESAKIGTINEAIVSVRLNAWSNVLLLVGVIAVKI